MHPHRDRQCRGRRGIGDVIGEAIPDHSVEISLGYRIENDVHYDLLGLDLLARQSTDDIALKSLRY
jgi:hypothetical protein